MNKKQKVPDIVLFAHARLLLSETVKVLFKDQRASLYEKLLNIPGRFCQAKVRNIKV